MQSTCTCYLSLEEKVFRTVPFFSQVVLLIHGAHVIAGWSRDAWSVYFVQNPHCTKGRQPSSQNHHLPLLQTATTTCSGHLTCSNNSKMEPNTMSTSDQRLLSLGYRPEFRREMSLFGVLGMSFCAIGILTGMSSAFQTGLFSGGPLSLFWGWNVCSLFMFFIALGLAEICSAYPTMGGLYFWVCKMKPDLPFLGFCTGWLYTVAMIFTGTSGNLSTIHRFACGSWHRHDSIKGEDHSDCLGGKHTFGYRQYSGYKSRGPYERFLRLVDSGWDVRPCGDITGEVANESQ